MRLSATAGTSRNSLAMRSWQFLALTICRDPPAVESAGAHFRQALGLAGELGMRPLQAHCHLGLGKLYRRTGDRKQAQQHLTTATAMYREMDLRFWLEQAEAELSQRSRER